MRASCAAHVAPSVLVSDVLFGMSMYDLRVLRGADLFECRRRASHPELETRVSATVMQQLDDDGVVA